MRLLLLACVASLATPLAARAQFVEPPNYPTPWPKTFIDRRTGDQVTITRFGDGPTELRVALRNGGGWTLESDGAGDLKGVDASGVRWAFDRRAKAFRALATGQTCQGSSWARLCS